MKSKADPNAHLPKASPPWEQRTDDKREPMYCRVTYTYERGGLTYSADGSTRDFSKKGCGIRGSIIPQIGSNTTLTVCLPGQRAPLYIEGTISWIAGDFFGVQFPEVSPKDYEAIRRYMWAAMNR